MLISLIIWLSTIAHPATIYHPCGNSAFIFDNVITDTEFNTLGTIIADTLYNADGNPLCSIKGKQIHIFKTNSYLKLKSGNVYDKWGRQILKIGGGKILDIQDIPILYYIHTSKSQYKYLVLYTIFFNQYKPNNPCPYL
jgi:hypothetical protein